MKRKERVAWVSLTAVASIIIAVLIFAPGVFAENTDAKIQKYLTLFEQVFKFVQKNYVDEVDPKVLYEGAMNGLFKSLDDPHSIYLTKSDMEELTDTTAGKFGGVGLYISKSSQKPAQDENGQLPLHYSPYVRIVAPIEDTPASKAGIHAGDLITKIEGTSTADMTVDEVVDHLRGTPGTDVNVTILRGADITFDVVLTRAVIEVPTAKHAMIPGGIGYVRIIQFTPFTEEKVQEAIEDFQKNHYTSLIIDVRNNPGGLLTAVVDTADLFLSGGVIVSTRSRIPSENAVYTATSNTLVPENIPIAVLIDKGSASAAEILAGALKDRHRGYLIGETTFGKGSVQQVKYLGEGGFKLTMSRYYTPSGRNIDKIGIDPDKEVKEKEFTDEENNSYKELVQNQTIEKFVKNNKPLTQEKIDQFVTGLKKQGNTLEERILKKLIRNEINRTNDTPPVYDLDFDIVLQEAVKMLKAGEIK